MTKTKVMKRLARSMTKSFKDQGHPVPNGAVLNALAAADGSFNWHVFVKKADAQEVLGAAAAPTSVWVGIHDHKRGDDVYVGRTHEDVFAIKRNMALENIDTEYPEYKDDGPMTDEQKVAYYWDAASETSEEWFSIAQYDLEPTSAAAVVKQDASNPAQGKVVVTSEGPVFRSSRDGLVAPISSAGEKGWFDVEAYSTKELWEGPSQNDDGLEGFETLEDAIKCAKGPEFSRHYKVVVTAYGQHPNYEPGERVWVRDSNESQVKAEIASMLITSTAHVTEAEAKVLDAAGYSRGEYGWLLHVGGSQSVPAEIGEPSEGLLGAINRAKQKGCDYLLFDRDADQLDGVATYRW